MSTPSADKGNKFEREVAAYLRDHLGVPVVHRLRNGGIADRGDIQLGSTVTLELKCYPSDPLRGIREGLAELPHEQAMAGTPHGAVISKRPGKSDPADSLVVMRLGDALELFREAL